MNEKKPKKIKKRRTMSYKFGHLFNADKKPGPAILIVLNVTKLPDGDMNLEGSHMWIGEGRVSTEEVNKWLAHLNEMSKHENISLFARLYAIKAMNEIG